MATLFNLSQLIDFYFRVAIECSLEDLGNLNCFEFMRHKDLSSYDTDVYL